MQLLKPRVLSTIRRQDYSSGSMSNEHKIKQSDVADLRAKMLSEQAYRCALCGHSLDPSEAALDHCHKTGRVRGVLHSSCNILLGKVENFVGRYGQKLLKYGRLSDALHEMHTYMVASYNHNPLHYKHKTEEDKLLSKYRRLLKRSKRNETKEKYRNLIREITDERKRTEG